MNKDNKRTEILIFRVAPGEKKLIETKTYSSYRLVSMYLRDCALDKEIIVIDGVYAVDLTETKKEVQKVWQSLNSLPQAVR